MRQTDRQRDRPTDRQTKDGDFIGSCLEWWSKKLLNIKFAIEK